MLWSIFVTYIITHHGLGGFSELINGLIAASTGTLSMLMSGPIPKSNVKRTRTYVCPFTLDITLHYITLHYITLHICCHVFCQSKVSLHLESYRNNQKSIGVSCYKTSLRSVVVSLRSVVVAKLTLCCGICSWEYFVRCGLNH